MILFSEKKAFYDDLKQTYMANGYWNTFFQKLRFDEIGPKLLDPNYWVLRAVLRSGNGDF